MKLAKSFSEVLKVYTMMMMQTQLKQVLYCPEMICRGQHNLRFDQQIVKDIFWLSVYGRCDNGAALEL